MPLPGQASKTTCRDPGEQAGDSKEKKVARGLNTDYSWAVGEVERGSEVGKK